MAYSVFIGQGGDVVGPGAATDGGICVFDGGSGKLIREGFPGAARGAVIYYGASGWTYLPAGGAGLVLTAAGVGADPSWTAPAGTGDVVGPAGATNNAFVLFDGTTGKLIKGTGTSIAVTQGGTGLTSWTTGDLVYASASTTLAGLADVATGSVLVSGGIGVAPSWSGQPQVSSINVTQHVGLKEASGSHYLNMSAATGLTATRTLTIGVNDANRTLTIAGNATISGTNTGDQTITLTGAVTGSGTGSIATTYSTVGVAYGGTGLTSYAIGDLIYASGATTLATIADVVAGKFLRSGGIGVAPAWSTLSLPNSATQGDILYATSANTIGSLADVAVGQVLTSGGVGAAPIWSSGPSLSSVIIKGATSGTLTLAVPAVAGTNTLTFPAGTTDFSLTGGTSQVVKQTSAGGAFTVAQLAASDLSNGTTGSGSVALSTSPTFSSSIITPIVKASSATTLTLSTDGKLTMTNAAATAGFLVDATTNGTAAFQTTAGADTATVKANTLQATGTAKSTLAASDTAGTVGVAQTPSSGYGFRLNTSGSLAMDLYNGSSWTEGAQLSSSGVLTVNGFGAHTFSAGGTGGNRLKISNTTSGTGNFVSLDLVNNDTDPLGFFQGYSSTFTTTSYSSAGGVALGGQGVGGISITATHASGDVRIYSRNALAATFGASQAATLTSTLSIPATKQLYLDGGGDTYISESSANLVEHYVGGAMCFRLTHGVSGNYATFLDDVFILAGKKLYLDGGSDTYIIESSNNVLSTYLDGGGDTYISESSANLVEHYVGGAMCFRLTHGVSGNYATFLDDVFILEYDANRLAWYGGGTLLGLWSTGGFDIRTSIIPADNTYSCGDSTHRFTAVYAVNGTIQTSDRTRKHNIMPATLGLEFVQRLQPVEFTMNDEAEGVRRHGLIAQDVIEAAQGASLTGILTGDTEGDYGLNYAGFVPALIAAIQQQQARIDALEARVH